MKAVILLIGLSLSSLCGVSQQLTAQVVNNTGFDLKGAVDAVITVSIGEPAIATFSTPDFILTQGFLQPEIIPCRDNQIIFYPNPTHDDLTIQSNGCDVQIQHMELIDMWGRLLTTILPAADSKVKLGDISPGMYFIRVILTNSNTQTIKIAKVSN